MNTPCQRWRQGRDSYRPAGEPIDTRRYGVEVMGKVEAKAFVETQHYSGSYPAERMQVGLYHVQRFFRPELVGVAVFSVPMQQAVIPALSGQPPELGVELGRLVLLDEVPANGETWMLGQAFELVRQELPEVRAIVAYSDPLERTTASGAVVKPGHVGTIYHAHNAVPLGRGKPRVLILAPTGEVVSERTLSKLRRGERGEAYAYEQLVRWGAPSRCPLESGPAYVARALTEGPFRRVRHPGNLRFGWGVGDRRQRRQALHLMRSTKAAQTTTPERAGR